MARWTSKEARQYEHIKESTSNRGAGHKRAKEIAARTVNKQRRQRGQTPSKRTQGTGNPNVPPPQRSRQELYNQAKQMKIAGRSKMNKQQLTRAVQGQR